jgi:N-acetylglutamate synthase-like GNAT family acetyltransferase
VDSEPKQQENHLDNGLTGLLEKVHIVPFKYKHLAKLIEMYKEQDYEGLDEMTMQHLPKIGYIAFLDKHAIAAGFLRKVEGGLVAQMDGLVSNPQFGSIIRHKAINLIVDQLKEDAKSLKLKGIYAFTLDYSVIERAEVTGFQRMDHTIMALRLTKE